MMSLTVIRSFRRVRFDVDVADKAYSLIPSANFSSWSPTYYTPKMIFLQSFVN